MTCCPSKGQPYKSRCSVSVVLNFHWEECHFLTKAPWWGAVWKKKKRHTGLEIPKPLLVLKFSHFKWVFHLFGINPNRINSKLLPKQCSLFNQIKELIRSTEKVHSYWRLHSCSHWCNASQYAFINVTAFDAHNKPWFTDEVRGVQALFQVSQLVSDRGRTQSPASGSRP